MSAPDYNTWDGDSGSGIVPRRPSTDDLGGDELENDPKRVPIPGEMPTAEAWNQFVKQITSLARVAPAAVIDMHFTAGAPAIVGVTGPRVDLVAGNFTVTDLGTGVTKIEPAAGKLPVKTWKPVVSLIGDNGGGTNTPGATVEEIATGWTVRTFRNNAAADIDFTLRVSGL